MQPVHGISPWRQFPNLMIDAVRCGLIAFWLLAGWGLGASVMAAPDPVALEHFIAGDFTAAATAAIEIGDSENLAFAARSLNSAAYFEDHRKTARKLADRAFDLGEAAIDKDPLLVEAHLQSAIALALRGANMSSIKAFFKNIPSRAKKRIDRALELEPENQWELSTSAAWHFEVVREGGGRVYGADREIGFEQFEAARVIAPDNVSIAYEFALRLLGSEEEKFRAPALAALDRALSLEPQSALEEKIVMRVQGLAISVENGSEAEKEFIKSHR